MDHHHAVPTVRQELITGELEYSTTLLVLDGKILVGKPSMAGVRGVRWDKWVISADFHRPGHEGNFRFFHMTEEWMPFDPGPKRHRKMHQCFAACAWVQTPKHWLRQGSDLGLPCFCMCLPEIAWTIRFYDVVDIVCLYLVSFDQRTQRIIDEDKSSSNRAS